MKTTRLQLSLLALFLGCASLQAQYKWADPLKQDFHTVRGQAWQDELKDSYAPLPQRAEDKVDELPEGERKKSTKAFMGFVAAKRRAVCRLPFQRIRNKGSLRSKRRTLYAPYAGYGSFGHRSVCYRQ